MQRACSSFAHSGQKSDAAAATGRSHPWRMPTSGAGHSSPRSGSASVADTTKSPDALASVVELAGFSREPRSASNSSRVTSPAA